MPHFEMHYSANLDKLVDFDALCVVIAGEMASMEIFEAGGIRVRAIACDHYAIADAHPRNGFVDMVLRIGAGRSGEAKKAAGDDLFDLVSAFVAPLLEEPHFALSLEIQEIDPELSWKRNSIHPRLRNNETEQ